VLVQLFAESHDRTVAETAAPAGDCHPAGEHSEPFE